MSNWAIILRCLGGAIVGILPGLAIAQWGSPQIGVAVGVIGAIAGALLSLPGVSLSRTMRLLVSMVVTRNIPTSGLDFDWVDRSQPVVDDPANLNSRFMRWVFATHIVHRRRWMVLVGLIAGVIAGAAITAHDVIAIGNGKQGLLLPMQGAQDSLTAQGVLMTLACAIWSGSLFAILAAPAYRRIVVLTIFFTGCLSSAIAFASDDGQGAGPTAFVVAACTAAAILALAVGSFVSPEDVEQTVQRYESPLSEEDQ